MNVRNLLIALLCCPMLTTAQPHMLQPAELDHRLKKQPRPVVIFVYTDWCRYCRAMEQTTFKNRELIQHLNQYFYFISFNAEEKKTIRFLGRDFVYRPTGYQTGEHELAAFLRRGEKAGYPALYFLSPEAELLFRISSFMNATDLIKLLKAIPKNSAIPNDQ